MVVSVVSVWVSIGWLVILMYCFGCLVFECLLILVVGMSVK